MQGMLSFGGTLLRILLLQPFKLDGLFLNLKLSFTKIIRPLEFLSLLHVGPGIIVIRVEHNAWVFTVTTEVAYSGEDYGGEDTDDHYNNDQFKEGEGGACCLIFSYGHVGSGMFGFITPSLSNRENTILRA